MKKVRLSHNDGSVTKFYHIQMEPEGDGYVVNFQYGYQDGHTESGTKTPVPVKLAQARNTYSALKDNKIEKGYIPDDVEVSLFNREGSANKEYHIQLVAEVDGYIVNFQYGRSGKPLKTGTKTAEPVDHSKAEDLYFKLMQSKIKGGYTEDSAGKVVAMQKVGDKVHSGFKPMLLKEGRFDEIEENLEDLNDEDAILQEKLDGENRSVIIDGDQIIGVDKKGFIVPLPDRTVNEVKKLNLDGRHVLNGEEMAGGRIVFFDVAAAPDFPEGEVAFERRLSALYTILTGANQSILDLAQDNVGGDPDAFVEKLRDENAEGFVKKRRDGLYDQAARNNDQVKYKFLDTVSCVVEKQNEGKRSVSLRMFDDQGNGVNVGNVTIPSNADIPAAGAFVEIEYLYAYEEGSLFQPVFKCVRTDIDETDCCLSTRKIKREEPAPEVQSDLDDGPGM